MQQHSIYIELGDAAIGTIQPDKNQQERLDEFTRRVSGGEFHKEIIGGVTIPVRCVDGRNIIAGVHSLAPNSAGGTESLFVADDLTTKRFAGDDNSTVAGYTSIIKTLISSGYEIGGHTDSRASGETSGCGANDKLQTIYQYMHTQGDMLRLVAAQLGVEVSDDTHQLIVDNAASRTAFSPGSELLSVLKANANDEFIDHLDGDHHEVIAVINNRHNTTLDRDALQHVFGMDYQVFNVDVWSFQEAASVISDSHQEAAQKVAAMAYYNLATTYVLGGPHLRVIVLQ